MSETTVTSNYQLKMIGTGRESATWGESNNENLVRLESALGKTVSLSVVAMPLGSVSASSNGSTPATWITVSASDSTTSEIGSEGRSKLVEFTGTVTGNITVGVRGRNSGEIPARAFWVKNSLTAPYTLTLEAGGTNATIANGRTAFVIVVPAATGGYTQGVHKLLDNIELANLRIASGGQINFLGAGTIDFDGAATMILPNGTATALAITNGVSTVIALSTQSGNQVTLNSGIVNTQTQNTSFLVRDASTLAFNITDGTTQYIAVDSQNNKLLLSTDLDMRAQILDFLIKPNDANALDITDGTNQIVKFDTVTGTIRIRSAVPITLPDMLLTGTDAYINFNTVEGSGGYGMRDNAGVPEVKKTGGSWNQIAAYRLGLAIANASASLVASANKMGSFDVGPIRLIFNTVDVGGSGSLAITLGTAEGTSVNMATTLYTVMVCQADSTSGASQNARAWVTSPASRTFTVECNANRLVTYIAIGDSGL